MGKKKNNHRFQTVTLLVLERSGHGMHLHGWQVGRAAGQHSSHWAIRFIKGYKGFSPCPETLCQSTPSAFCHSAIYHQCLELSQPVTVTAIKRHIPPPGKGAKTISSPVATFPLLHSGTNSRALSQTLSERVTTSPSRAAFVAAMLMS